MAAQSWRSFMCCGGGGAAVHDDDDSAPRRRRIARRGDSPRSSSRMSFTSLSSSGTLSPEDLSLTLSGSNLYAFTYAELRAATGNFSRANYLGCGGFGPVYKGAVDDGLRPGLAAQDVAVKYLDLDCGTQGHKEWLAEVFFLGQLRHKNLVKLIGYCYEAEHRMLVYEYMSGESLEKHLFKTVNGSLPWMTRMKIALGAAKGLAFLHDADPPVIYRDFKASNILLDLNPILKGDRLSIGHLHLLDSIPKTAPDALDVLVLDGGGEAELQWISGEGHAAAISRSSPAAPPIRRRRSRKRETRRVSTESETRRNRGGRT